MKIQEIFEKDIFRYVNSTVVVSDDEPSTIDMEIDEYVFTDELIEKIFEMVDTVLNKKKGKSGIWINGYYGSGKSHFIKFIHYLLDPKTSERTFEVYQKAVYKYDSMKAGGNDKITPSNVALLKNKVSSSNCDNIMFNVEDMTDESTQERVTQIFINMFNKFRGYNSHDIPLAILLEKPLDEKGVFEAFKTKFNTELGKDWESDGVEVAAFELENVLDIAKSLCPELDVASLHGKLSNPGSYPIGISHVLIPELKGYLKQKKDSYRLLFLVDEVSQYIGTNKELLLNFQSIIERVSIDCDNQVWIACTAQETLDHVSSGTDDSADGEDEFGKILGRFDTRISLQSSDASHITQRRVLDKTEDAIGVLKKMYNENKDYIENQFKISHELFKGYQDEEEFTRSYPFVPYQFKLIAHVFEAFQQLEFVIKEVKDNERSVLGITHFTAKEHANDEIGGFISFDAFYNKQFHTNLEQRGSRAIQNGLELPYVKETPFAEKVVKVLFMISNLLESQRQTFPSNLDNLTVLLMDQLNQNKRELQHKIQKVLDKLIEERIIREDKDSYFFFNEDEMDVQNLINNQTINIEDRWSEFDEIIREMLGIRLKVPFGQTSFKVAYSIDSKNFFPNGDICVKVLLTDQETVDQKALDVAKKDLVLCINEWYSIDFSLKKDFELYCKTQKYFKSNSGGIGKRAITDDNFKSRNNLLSGKIKETIEAKFSETRFISQNRVLEASEVNGVKPKERFDNLINKHLGNIYKMYHLCEYYAKNQAELKTSTARNQIPLSSLTPAEETVNDMITTNNGQMTIHDLITNFAKEPFGWTHDGVLDILVHLVKKKKREFQYKGQPRFPIVDFINKAVSTREQMSCEVITGEDIDQTMLDKTLQSFNNIFNENISVSTDGNDLCEILTTAINKHIDNLTTLKEKYKIYPFGSLFSDSANLLSDWVKIRDPKRLFSEINEGETRAKELIDKTKKNEDYLIRVFDEYKDMKAFNESNNENFKELSEVDQDKGSLLKSFLEEEDITNSFRDAKNSYDELKLAISSHLKDLKIEVEKVYEEIFTELDKVAEARKCPRDKYAQQGFVINEINNLNSITSLENKRLSISDFKTDELAKILAHTSSGQTAKATVNYRVASVTSVIKTQTELDQFILKVKDEMEKILSDDKTIIIK